MGMIVEQDKEFLKEKFGEELQEPVKILAFTESAETTDLPGFECEFSEEVSELIDELASLSDKISVEHHVYRSDDELVKKLGVDKLPALVLTSGESSGIRYFGVPGGYEFGSLIEDIVDLSRETTDLSQESKEVIRALDRDIHIQVFMTPMCPHCPSAVRIAHQMAIENPRHVVSDAVEVSEFPHLVSRYGIEFVPTIVINDVVRFEGALPDELFAEQVTRALSIQDVEEKTS